MKNEQSIAIMKALADQSRLAIVHSLLENSQYVEEIAKRHALAPSTVSFHLRKLEQAGLVRTRKEQYYVVIEANAPILETTLREIVSAVPIGRKIQDQRMSDYKRKVLESFFRNGKLEKLPAQHKKRLIVLEQFAKRFEPERRYDEEEVTGLIMPLFEDYCTIRRLLVDEGLVHRDGVTYWREEKGRERGGAEDLPAWSRKISEDIEKVRRTEIKKDYKRNSPDMGVYQIRNKANGKIYVSSTTNLEGTRNSRLFQLRMGKIVFNRGLQGDVNEFGAENFEFSILAVLDKPLEKTDIEHSLAELELHWVKKLQPFGEQGYNSKKAYQRSLEKLKIRRGGNQTN